MINDEANNCYYFAVTIFSELNSLGWLRGKKEVIINNNNSFQNAIDDAVSYRNIEKELQTIIKIKAFY